MTDSATSRDPASFRDPTGFVYRRDGILYRQINAGNEQDWEQFQRSGLFQRLVDRRWLIEHEEIEGVINLAAPAPLPNAEFMRALRQAFPKTPIVADLKTMDGGYLEAATQTNDPTTLIVFLEDSAALIGLVVQPLMVRA